MTELSDKLQSNSELVEQKLEEVLQLDVQPGEIARPKNLIDAMRYGVLNGGKRLRPFLVIETAKLFGIETSRSLDVAAALELIHCYSLVHDDLPAMDDDPIRRGKPTAHIAFDEATAILAGDSLLTLAFRVLANVAGKTTGGNCIELFRLFSDAAGIGGMAGGQMFDLEAESRTLSVEETLEMQAMKTGALIRCACEAGAILGGAPEHERQAIIQYGLLIGQAYQLTDDILDTVSDAKTLGKNTGKDTDRGKSTLVNLLGLEAATAKANALKDEAISVLTTFGEKNQTLTELASYMVERKN